MRARQRFRELADRDDDSFNLAEAVACIGWEDQALDEPSAILAELDALAAGFRPRMAALGDPERLIAAFNRYLFDEQDFHGNPTCYDHPDPADSFLDHVLRRRMGLPILVSLVYLEVGWRLGLDVDGVGLPGHFIVRYRHGQQIIYLDPYDRGRIWSYEDCLRQISVFQSEISPDMIASILDAAPRRAILLRILRNLKVTYLSTRDFRRALATSERLTLIDPSDVAELRDQGLLRFRLGQTLWALEALERYVRQAPNAPDLFDLRAFAISLVNQFYRKN